MSHDPITLMRTAINDAINAVETNQTGAAWAVLNGIVSAGGQPSPNASSNSESRMIAPPMRIAAAG